MVTDGGSQSALSFERGDVVLSRQRDVHVTPTVTLQANYFYRAPVNIERGRFSAMQMTTSRAEEARWRQHELAVRFPDPFDTMKFRIVAGDDNLTQITARKFGVRATVRDVPVELGQAPKIRPPREEPAQPAPVFPVTG